MRVARIGDGSELGCRGGEPGVVPEAVKSHRELSEHPDAELAVGLPGSIGKQLRRPGDRPRPVLENPDRRQHAAPHSWLGIRGEHVLGEVAAPR